MLEKVRNEPLKANMRTKTPNNKELYSGISEERGYGGHNPPRTSRNERFEDTNNEKRKLRRTLGVPGGIPLALKKKTPGGKAPLA